MIAAVIPAYNESRFLPGVVERVRPHVDRVFVVDDGSGDGTGRVNATVLRHDRNRGKGAALRTGIGAALRTGCETIVTLDGDGQHDPAAVPSLLEALDGADLVIGSRSRSGSMPPQRRLSNGFSAVLVSLVAGRPLADVHSGFRAYRAAKLRSLEIRSRRFEVEVELLLKAARSGWRIAHVPVPTLYGTERSKIRPALDSLRFLRTVAWHALGLDGWIATPHGNGWRGSNSRRAGSAIPAS